MTIFDRLATLLIVTCLGMCLVPAAVGQSVIQTELKRPEVIFLPPTIAHRTGTLKLKSKLMAREMHYRIVFPAAYYRDETSRFPVIYLLHGLTGSHADWLDRTKLGEYSETYRFIIVTPEGNNGWYSDSVTAPNDKYESYIVKELIPEVDKTHRTLASREGRVIAGLSMGGYGSLKFGLKYPEMFALVGSFSGALGAASFTEKSIGNLGKSIDAIFGPADGQARSANDVFKLVREISPEKLKALPFVYQSCGTEDFLIQNNRDFLAVLNQKKVPHEYREHPGGHDWKFWDEQVREFLSLAARRVKK